MSKQITVIVNNMSFAHSVMTKNSHIIKSQIVFKIYKSNLQI